MYNLHKILGSKRKSESQRVGFSLTRPLTTSSNKYDFIISVCMILLIAPKLYSLTISHWQISSHFWSHTEWLLSYDGGFVRRGISGEIIKLFYHLFEIYPSHMIVMIAMFTYIVVSCWVFKLCGRKYPIYFLLSAMLLGAPIFTRYFFFKDLLIILLYMLSSQTIISTKNRIIKFILFNIFSSFAILTHEIYLFICLPFLVFIYNKYEQNKYFSFNFLPFFSVSFIVAILVLLNRGNGEIVYAIMDYWNDFFSQTEPPYCCFNFIFAFQAIATDWFDSHLLAQKYWWTKFHFGILWLPFMYFCIWLACGSFVSKIISHYDEGKEKTFMCYYYLHLLCSIPLYILAYDYGRWILHSTLITRISHRL